MAEHGVNVEIVELAEHDLESLAGLYRHFWNEESDVARMRTVFQRLASNPDYIFLGAKLDGELVGSVMGIVCEELYGQCLPFMVIEDVVVDGESRRRGVGSRLMVEMEQRAADRNCQYIIFVTEQERSSAHRFYESLGYSPDKYKGFKKKLGDG